MEECVRSLVVCVSVHQDSWAISVRLVRLANKHDRKGLVGLEHDVRKALQKNYTDKLKYIIIYM